MLHVATVSTAKKAGVRLHPLLYTAHAFLCVREVCRVRAWMECVYAVEGTGLTRAVRRRAAAAGPPVQHRTHQARRSAGELGRNTGYIYRNHQSHTKRASVYKGLW